MLSILHISCGGKRIFPIDGSSRPMQLAGCRTTATGVLVTTYVPA